MIEQGLSTLDHPVPRVMGDECGEQDPADPLGNDVSKQQVQRRHDDQQCHDLTQFHTQIE